MVDVVLEIHLSSSFPTIPVHYSPFLSWWIADAPTLHIDKRGRYFRDLCNKLKLDLSHLPSDDPRYVFLKKIFNDHRSDATQECIMFLNIQQNTSIEKTATSNTSFSMFRKGFCYLMLTKRLKQTHQLNLFTGLKFDLFDVGSSNDGFNFIYGLPEGHYPNEKPANMAISMLHHNLETQRQF